MRLATASRTSRQTSTIATPTMTSMTKWFAVATTASIIAAGPITASVRNSQWRVAPNTTMPRSRFQPAWKLGMAAYSLTIDGGTICR